MTKGKGKMPGASGLDKHIKRKEHKERSQPAHRARLGQLEKSKDHALRSKKRRAKVQRLKEVKRAAAQRNPDEFSMGMTKAIMDVATGKMKQRRTRQGLDEKEPELKKTIHMNQRNVQYLEFKANADRSRATELLNEDATAALTAQAPSNKHIVFVHDEDEFKHFNPLAHFDATPDMLQQHPALRGRVSVVQNTVLPDNLLLSGNHMKSVSQRRKERRELQEKFRRRGATEAEQRQEIVEHMRVQRDMKLHRFSDLVAAEQTGAEDEDSSAAQDEVQREIAGRRLREQHEAKEAALRMREITQRVDRAKSLTALAKTIRRQNHSIERQLKQRQDSRFKPNASRRAS